jgi:sulfite exporter TauE/SafE
MKLTARRAILLSGLLWMVIGIFLLFKGISYLSSAGNAVISGTHEGFSLIKKLTEYTKNPQQSALLIICTSLLMGFFKGRVVFKRTVNRVATRIRSQKEPISLRKIYSLGYVILIAGMMGLGMIFKFLPLPLDVKGFLDFTIGVALINGAMLYARAAFSKDEKFLL